MAIKVKHATNPSVVLQAGYGVSRDKERRRLEEKERKIKTEQLARESQRAFQEKMVAQRQGFQAGEAQLGREFRAGEVDKSRDWQEGILAQRQEFQIGQMERRQEIAQENIEYEHTIEEKKLDDGYRAAMNSDAFTIDEKKEIKRKYLAKKAGFKQTATPKKSPYPENQGKGQAWIGKEGKKYTRDDKGNVKILYDPTKHRIEAYKIAIGLFTDKETGKVDMEKVEDFVRRAMGVGSGQPIQGGGEGSQPVQAIPIEEKSQLQGGVMETDDAEQYLGDAGQYLKDPPQPPHPLEKEIIVKQQNDIATVEQQYDLAVTAYNKIVKEQKTRAWTSRSGLKNLESAKVEAQERMDALLERKRKIQNVLSTLKARRTVFRAREYQERKNAFLIDPNEEKSQSVLGKMKYPVPDNPIETEPQITTPFSPPVLDEEKPPIVPPKPRTKKRKKRR